MKPVVQMYRAFVKCIRINSGGFTERVEVLTPYPTPKKKTFVNIIKTVKYKLLNTINSFDQNFAPYLTGNPKPEKTPKPQNTGIIKIYKIPKQIEPELL